MIELKLPEIGENIDHAEVSRVLVSEGDTVQVDQNVLDLESDKASFPLPSTHAGRIAKIRVKAGDTVAVGQTLMEIEAAQEAKGDGAEPAKGSSSGAPKDTAPTKGQGDAAEATSSGDGRKAAKPPGESVPAAKKPKPTRPRPGAEKTQAAPPAPAHQEKEEEPAKDEEPAKAGAQDVAEEPGRSFVAAGPATRALARELGVHLEEVSGHGPGGRVTREDVKAFVHRSLAGSDGGSQTKETSEAPAVDFGRWGPVDRQRLSPLGRTMARRLSLAWRLVPHVTQHDLADITEMEAARKNYNDAHHGTRPKITPTALAIRAVVVALKTFPRFNSSLDTVHDELILKNYYHIGVAVDTEHGLLVPVLRDANRKSLVDLAVELAQLAERARARTLTTADMEGGTFTISNLGGIGGIGFTPIVNHPEVAILGMSRARWELVAGAEKTERRLLLPLSLSYDHRVIDGAAGARFTAKVAGLLADPFQMLAEASP